MLSNINLLNLTNQLYKFQSYQSGLTSKADSRENNIYYSVNQRVNPYTNSRTVSKVDFSDIINSLIPKENHQQASDIKDLLDEFKTLNLKKTVASSNPEAVTGVADKTAEPLSFELNIEQTAQSQITRGHNFDSDTLSGYNTDKYVLNIEQGGKNYFIGIELDSGDTHSDAMSKIAHAINYSDANVTASVDEENGQSQLMIQSDNTGESAAFKISDVVGDISNKYFTNSVNETGDPDFSAGIIQQAQDSIIKVNGREYKSDTNRIQLSDYGVTLDIKEKTIGDIKVDIDYDKEFAFNLMNEFTNKTNDFFSRLSNDSNDYSDYFLSETVSGLKNVEGEIKSLGLNFDFETNKFSVDETNLNLAQGSSAAKETLNSEYGFMSFMENQINDYVSKPLNIFSETNYSLYNVSRLPNNSFYTDNIGELYQITTSI